MTSKNNITKKLVTLFAVISITALTSINLYGQPNWVPPHPDPNPSYSNLTAINVDLNFELDGAGTIYWVIFPYDGPAVAPVNIKLWHDDDPHSSFCGGGSAIYTAGDIGTVITRLAENLFPGTFHSVHIVTENLAETAFGTTQKLTFTTDNCPSIDILTGFSQPQLCINIGTSTTFQVVLLDPPNSGILKGTTWTIDWGDGTPVTNFTSSVNYEIPPLALRQHVYSTITNCNYVFTNSIQNTCGESRSVQYVAAVHGRDIPSDGDGVLSIVNNATGNPVIQVCEETETIITLRDNSTWNCQNPVLPGGLTPDPNDDTRNIEWLYGQDPLGAITNTINGTVDIATLGNAPQASGRGTPDPYGSTSLSQSITIPATCQSGEYFRVYLKNWNKCNWDDADYVSTFVDIEVVAAPTAPTAPSRAVCIDDDKTLTVTSVPTGTITWYSDAGLTTPVGTGITYIPTETLPGSYDYYVTDRESSGLLCESFATTVNLTISQKPNTPTIDGDNKNDICFGVEPPESYIITASTSEPPAVTSYQWYLNGALLPGRTSDTLIVSKVEESGLFRAVAIGPAPTFCPSDQSDTLRVTVHTLLNVTQPIDQTICEGEDAVFFATTTENIATWHWETSTDGGLTFSETGEAPPYDGAFTNTLTLTAPSITLNGNLYRLEMKTPQGQGGCAFKSDAALLTIDGIPTANAGPPVTICTPTPLDPILMTGATRGGSAISVVWSGGEAQGTWTQNADPALSTFTPTVTSGSFVATLSLTGSGACTGSYAGDTRLIEWSHEAVVNAGPDQSICAMGTVPLAGTIGGGALSATWTGGLGTYNPNDTTLNAVYTPHADERAAHTVTLTLTTDNPTGICPAVNDDITIEIGTVISAATLTTSGDGCAGVTTNWLNVEITGGAPRIL